MAAQITHRVTGNAGGLGTVENGLSAADISLRQRTQEFLQVGLLFFRIDVQSRQQFLATFLNRGGEFFEPGLQLIGPQTGKPLRLVERGDQFQPDGLGTRVVECAQQAGDFQRPGRFECVGEFDELILAELGAANDSSGGGAGHRRFGGVKIGAQKVVQLLVQ